MSLSSLIKALGNKAIPGESMSKHTTFGIGGPADLFAVAQTLSELRRLVRLSWEHDVGYTIMGGGANVLVADKGIRGLVIQNRCARIDISAGEDGQTQLVKAESGAALSEVARETMSYGLAGLEWAVDVPGTVGGAVVGNAGAFGGYISDSLRSALVFSPMHGERWWPSAELKLDYRSSVFKGSKDTDGFPPVVLAALFVLRSGDESQIREQARQYSQRRLESQPVGPSAGSVFKRTAQYPAGFLIENAGLKGTRIGGAVVSPQHANFIVNLGTATAQDVRQLIETIEESVYRKFKVKLEREIEFIGEWQA